MPPRRTQTATKKAGGKATNTPQKPYPQKPYPKGRKRKLAEIEDVSEPVVTASVSPKKSKADVEEDEPPRLKKWRPRPPQTIQQRLERVQTQTMYCLGRERDEANLEEVFKIAGSTGNVYTVTIRNIPTCDCPDGTKNGICKHVLFVLTKVLKVRADLSYQAALLNSELHLIFQNSKVPGAAGEDGNSSNGGKRKPLEQDGCPICYEDFKSDKGVVFCIAQCGTNIHKKCFQMWSATKSHRNVPCPICRAVWTAKAPDTKEYGGILEKAELGEEGYLNVGEELGLPTYRDDSSYHYFNPRSRYGRWS